MSSEKKHHIDTNTVCIRFWLCLLKKERSYKVESERPTHEVRRIV